MAKAELNFGELGGGSYTYEYNTTTIASGGNQWRLPTNCKAKGVIAVSTNYTELILATEDEEHPKVNGTLATNYTMTFTDSYIDFGGVYASSATTFNYYYWY